MGYFVLVLIFGFIIMNMNSENKTLKRENQKLREKIRQLKLTNESSSNNDEPITTDSKEEIKDVRREVQLPPRTGSIPKRIDRPIVRKQIKERPIRDETETKNTAILVAGAICIVLAAIVFLTSTWNMIPDILKTIVLLLLTGVFLGGSYLAKNKFGLDKASQAFFYIAMAYIPICLLSISVFGLLGYYLSIFGEGRYLYFVVTSVFVAALYYKTSTSMDNKYLLFGSILSQAFSIIMFSLVFSDDIIVIFINILVYNILLMRFTRRKLFSDIYNVVPMIIFVLIIPLSIKIQATTAFVILLLVVNYILLELKNTSKIYAFLFNISLMLFGGYTLLVCQDSFGMGFRSELTLVYILLAYGIGTVLLKGKNKENLMYSLRIVTICAVGIMHLESMISSSIISPYMISIIQISLLVFMRKEFSASGKTIVNIMIPVYFILTGIDIIGNFDVSYDAYVVFSIVTFVVTEFFRNKDKEFHLSCYGVSHLFIFITYLSGMTLHPSLSSNPILATLLLAVYVYCYWISKETMFKYISYVLASYVLYASFCTWSPNYDLAPYIPVILTLTIMTIEKVYKKLVDRLSRPFILFLQALSFVSIYYASVCDSSIETVAIINILLAVILVVYNMMHKDDLSSIVPLVFVAPALFLDVFTIDIQTVIMLVATLAVSIISLMRKRVSVFTAVSCVYLLLSFTRMMDITYLREILLIVWSASHFYFIENDKHKDIFKCLSYVSVSVLYYSIILKTAISAYTVVSMFGHIAVVLLTLKTVLVKYAKRNDLDIIEYVIFGIIYLVALARYTSELDGMIFGVLILAIIYLSYVKKYGALFMVSIATILVNVFVLTREFWFSLPWWIYLLVVGTLLITFAVRNEAKEKRVNLGLMIKNLKDKVEK